jgi:putative FmdB family regulatory protein
VPIYEYECTKCGMQTEAIQRFSDAPLTVCESCRGRLRKLISHSTFHLKGTGWYVTDYASKSGGGEKKESKSENKSEAKPVSTEKTETKEIPKSKEKPTKASSKPADK